MESTATRQLNSPIRPWQTLLSLFGNTSLRTRAWCIAGIYAVLATLWIYFSDAALLALLDAPELMVKWSVYKGLGFVTVTAVALLLMMRWAFGTIGDGYEALKIHEKEIDRLKKLYSALSHINQSIVWTKSREELFPRICESLTLHGGFSMAWIGWYEAESGTLAPVASSGDVNGYLKDIHISTDDRPEGCGAAGTAYREARPVISNNLSEDPSALPWHAKAPRHGLLASAVLPIRFKGTVCGTLNVYASEAGFFQEQEKELLAEAVNDISYALENLASEAERQRAEALAQREMQFSATMIETMPGILYFYNDQGRFMRWNKNFESVSGYTAEEISTMHPLDFFSSEDQRPLEERIAEVFDQGESYIEAPFQSKNGRSSPYYFTGRRVEYDGQRCLVGVGIDISERMQAEKALKKSEQRYRSTLENILEGCQIIGHDWTYLYLNHAATVHNRRPREELIGKPMMEMWPGIETTPIFTLLQRSLREGIALHEETEFTFLDGTSGWFDVRVQPVPEGIFVLSIDITERHQAEKALRDLNESLELKVIERTGQLQQALVRAEAADRLKSAFLATMSHELRTPLNSIIGFTGILLQGLAGPLNPEQNKQLGMVRGSARHLLELINDVLDISKIEAGQLEVRVEQFPLPDSIERVLASLKPLAEKKRLSLICHLSPEIGTVTGDRRRVEQILINLLNNAIKFTEHGSVTLTTEMETTGPCPVLRLSVADTGMGIKEEDLNNLFQPFRQIDTGLARQHEGTGLGLAICRRLIALMGGEISASSEWGKGSLFTVTLPQKPKPASQP
ncbi:PAS domain S-box-containing protein [Prosthecobacter fusiformis]|uniref:histidine kinase n=1 Tax=Prosthecobacter fusiformis TaxID=48464 RepID=A0A4R7RM73_9BACT|nr:PAS domain S-box protein [Prosthecobacter fusiformis]TDU66454.1 PAS domain S-box-containing protein [Prosthecobacter fusiformis]